MRKANIYLKYLTIFVVMVILHTSLKLNFMVFSMATADGPNEEYNDVVNSIASLFEFPVTWLVCPRPVHPSSTFYSVCFFLGDGLFWSLLILSLPLASAKIFRK